MRRPITPPLSLYVSTNWGTEGVYMSKENSTLLTLREEQSEIRKFFTSDSKPNLTRPLLTRWQQSVDVLAKLFNVPIAFVIQLEQDALKIVVVSKNDLNGLQPGNLLPIHGKGIYCETTIGRGEFFYVPDAEMSRAWEGAKFRAYAGYPMHWPDGESFGALCLLSTEPIEYTAELFHVLRDYQRLIERDLEHLIYNRHVDALEDAALVRMREVAHRAKNHFAILSNLIQIIAAKPIIDAKQTLTDIDAKMRTMALLHEMLYSSTSLELPVAQFLENVIHVTTQITHHRTRYSVDLASLPPMDSRHVFDLGLLVSELATNAIKNFDESSNALHISLACEVLDTSTVRLTFRDNGPGFSDEFLENPERLGSIGFTMLRSFTHLLNGSYSLKNDDGAVIECTVRI